MTNIYLAQHPTSKHIKIGRSNNPEKRLMELQVANSEKLELIYILPNIEESFESFMHDICENYHIKGEWFSEEVLSFLFDMEFYKCNLVTYSDYKSKK